jgi:hypothetical protein
MVKKIEAAPNGATSFCLHDAERHYFLFGVLVRPLPSEPLAATKAPARGGGWGWVRLANAANGRKCRRSKEIPTDQS